MGRNELEALYELVPFAGHLGIEAFTSSDGDVSARVSWNSKLCTAAGVLHGGVIMALADTCGAACAFANLPEGATGTTTIESKTNFFRAVRDGYVEARTTLLHAGRSTIVVETDVYDDSERRVARVTQTQAVLRPES